MTRNFLLTRLWGCDNLPLVTEFRAILGERLLSLVEPICLFMQRVCVGQTSPVNQTGGYGKGFPAACSLTTEYRGSKDQSDLAE
jgi:hypothetical protein